MGPIEFFQMGGPLMWAILATGVVGVFFIIERLVTLQRAKILPRAFVDRIRAMVAKGRISEALLLCEENRSSIARLMAAALRTFRRGKGRGEVKEAVEEVGNREVAHLDRHVEIIGTVATISPLLGLLGTVMGMIQVFQEFVDAARAHSATPETFASGIWTALITTAYGLMVAIPMLVVYKLLQGRNDRLIVAMEEDAMGLVDLLEDRAHAGRGHRGSRDDAEGEHGSEDRPRDDERDGSREASDEGDER